MKFKKIICFLLIGTISFSVVACQGKSQKKETVKQETEKNEVVKQESVEVNHDFVIEPSGREAEFYMNFEMSDGNKVRIAQLEYMILLSGNKGDYDIKEAFLGTGVVADMKSDNSTDKFDGVSAHYVEGNDIYEEDEYGDSNIEYFELMYGISPENVVKTAFDGRAVYVANREYEDIKGNSVIICQDVGSDKFLEISITDEHGKYSVKELVNMFIVAEREPCYEKVEVSDEEWEKNEVLEILD